MPLVYRLTTFMGTHVNTQIIDNLLIKIYKKSTNNTDANKTAC